MFGYLDESGAPGLATSKNDFLVTSLVIFKTKQSRDEGILKIETLRKNLNLPEDYEFHRSSNSIRIQKAFTQLLSDLDYNFITVGLQKTSVKNDATYQKLSKLLISELKGSFKKIKIEMDSNPAFYAELRKVIKESKKYEIKLRQRNSKHSRMIQLADYIVNLSSKNVKGYQNNNQKYQLIQQKNLRTIIK